MCLTQNLCSEWGNDISITGISPLNKSKYNKKLEHAYEFQLNATITKNSEHAYQFQVKAMTMFKLIK